MQSLGFLKDTSSRYRIFTDKIIEGTYKIIFIFDAKNHDLEKYFLYMSLKKYAKKYSFPNMLFKEKPPGEKFGPWPGWRFVPRLPELSLTSDGKTCKVQYFFTGDEFFENKLYACSTLDLKDEKNKITMVIDSDEIILLEVMAIKAHRIVLDNISLKIYTGKLNDHPRLLFDKNELVLLRSKKKTKHWNEIENLLKNWKLPWKITPECRAISGKERMDVIDKLAISAFHAVISENDDSIKRAIGVFQKFIEISSDKNFSYFQVDTQIGECLFFACLAYDWLYDYLNKKNKNDFKRYLKTISIKLKQFLLPERDDFAQAHFLGCVHGLLAYSLLFFEDEKDSIKDITYIASAFSTAMKMLSDDGSYPHGINLWIYEYNFLTRIAELLFRFTNQNHWKRKELWINSSLFRNYSTSYEGLYGITFGDPQYRVCGDAWIHYLIALKTNDLASYNYAKKIANLNVEGVDYRSVTPRRRILEYIYSEKPKNVTDNTLMTVKYFEDTGQVFIKEDKNKILFTVRAGAPLGITRYQMGEWGGYGHSDPCNGSFLIHKKDRFIICGPESSYKRNTEFHNTITINGCGQIGDKMVWAPDIYFDKNFPRITQFISNPDFVRMKMDLTNCYFNFLKVNLITREIIFLFPKIILGIDTIKLNEDNKIEWNLHTYGKIKYMSKHRLFEIKDNKEKIFFNMLGESFDFNFGKTPFIPGYPHSGKRDNFLKISSFRGSEQFIYLFNLDNNPASLNYSFKPKNHFKWEIDINNRRISWLIKYDSGVKSIRKFHDK